MSRRENNGASRKTARRGWFVTSEWLIPVGLVLLTVVIYSPTFENGFAYFDDDVYVVENPVVRQGLSSRSIAYAWTTFNLGNWIPLTWMSYELDVTVWGIRPTAFHAVDLALHVTSVLLLFYLMRNCTEAVGQSAILAAFWGVHPLHVESVAWIAERKDVLSTCFLLLSLTCYERYARRLQRNWYVGMCCAFLLGMLSKPMLVTLPALLLVFDIWPLQRWQRSHAGSPVEKFATQDIKSLICEKLPLLIVSVTFAGVMIWAQHSQSAIAITSLAPVPIRLDNVVESYGWYLIKTFMPIDLCPFYPLWLNPIDWPRLVTSATALGIVSVWVARCWRQRPWIASGWLWFLISLLPVIGIVQLGAAVRADRYSYVPHLGIISMLVWEISYWLARLPHGHRIGALLTGVLLMFYSALTYQQVCYWYSPQSLWNHAVEVDKNNWMAQFHLGRDCLRRNDPYNAIEHFQETIRLHPGYLDAYLLLGAIHQHQKQWSLAEHDYLGALDLDPNSSVALMNLGSICRQTNRLAAARDYLNRCVATNPTATRPREELKLLDRAE